LKNLLLRFISGTVFITLVIGSILLGPLYFTFLVLVFSFIGLNEYIQLSPYFIKNTKEKIILIGSGLIVFTSISMVKIDMLPVNYIYLCLSGFFPPLLYVLSSKYKKPLEVMSGFIFGIIYIALPFALIPSFFFLNNSKIENSELLIGFFIILWSNDVFAYIIGSLIGRVKLYKRVSPNKTLEGTIGGITFSILSAFIISKFFLSIDTINWLALGFLISIFATLGDLIESLLKRQASVKDSGNIMPGHGGVLDRFDGVIFAIPVVYIYLSIIY
jgi:phosphatidate cytidylyltransferase